MKNLKQKMVEMTKENSYAKMQLLLFHISIELKLLLNLKVFSQTPVELKSVQSIHVAQKYDDEGKCNRNKRIQRIKTTKRRHRD